MIQTQTNTAFIEEETVLKNFVKIFDLATKIINYEEKEMIALTDSENKFYENYVKKSFVMIKMKKNKFKLHQKVRDPCHYTGKFRGAAHSICNLRYQVPQEIPVKIYNGSKYDYKYITSFHN